MHAKDLSRSWPYMSPKYPARRYRPVSAGVINSIDPVSPVAGVKCRKSLQVKGGIGMPIPGRRNHLRRQNAIGQDLLHAIIAYEKCE
jgi:hypothetical protein